MQKEDYAAINALMKGGLLGAALGALFAKDKEEGAVMGAILGAAVSATLQANKEAQQTKVPVYVEENGVLYAINASGEKRFIKNIEKSAKKLPETFKLK